MPFTLFEDWSTILATVKEIVAGEKSVEGIGLEGSQNFLKGGDEKK